MFRMLGNKVELIRYKITWQKMNRNAKDCVSDEHKNEVEQMLTEKNRLLHRSNRPNKQ